jgi:hypothetical protein
MFLPKHLVFSLAYIFLLIIHAVTSRREGETKTKNAQHRIIIACNEIATQTGGTGNRTEHFLN